MLMNKSVPFTKYAIVIAVIAFFIGAGTYTRVSQLSLTKTIEVKDKKVSEIPLETDKKNQQGISTQEKEKEPVETNSEEIVESQTEEIDSTVVNILIEEPVKPNINLAPPKAYFSTYNYNFKDTKALVENKDNIFIGKVIKRIENYKGMESYYPSFVVAVIFNLKGDTEEEIRLIQADVLFEDGWTYIERNTIILATDIPVKNLLLQVGSTYAFAASYSLSNNFYTASFPPYYRELITTDSTLSDAAAIDLAKENARVQEFVEAARKLGMLNEEYVTPISKDIIDNTEIVLSTEKIDEWGTKIVNWKQIRITINGKLIDQEMPNFGGYSKVVWSSSATSFNISNLDTLRYNFIEIIKQSSCDIDELDIYIKKLDSTISQEKLADDLSCLGTFSFNEPSWADE